MSTNKPGGSRPETLDPDDDAPLLTAEFFEDAEYYIGDTFIRRGRGRPPTGNAKEQVSVRLDRDVLAKLREAGPGWQAQVSGLLRVGLGMDKEPAAPVLQQPAPEVASAGPRATMAASRGNRANPARKRAKA